MTEPIIINLNQREKYGTAGEKALIQSEKKFLEVSLIDELDLFIYYGATYGCLRLGELIQSRTKWLIIPTDQEDRHKLKIRVPDFDDDLFLKSKNNQSKQKWKCKTFRKKKSEPFPAAAKYREVVIHNQKAVQIIKLFLNKHPFGISELFPNCSSQQSIERKIRRRVESWVKPLQQEHKRLLQNDGISRTDEEIEFIILEQRSKLSTHPLRATGIMYLLDLGYNEYRVGKMVGNSKEVRDLSYKNNKDVEKVEIIESRI